MELHHPPSSLTGSLFSARRPLVARGRLLGAWITNRQKGLVCFLRLAFAEARGFLFYLLECERGGGLRAKERSGVWLARGGKLFSKATSCSFLRNKDRSESWRKGDAEAFGFKALLVIDSYRGSTFSATGWYSAFEEAMPKGRRIVQGALVEGGVEGGDVSEWLSF